MSTRTCQDCGSTEGVQASPVRDWPREWGPYYHCAACRAVLADLEMRALRAHEQHLLAEWGTIGQQARQTGGVA